MSRSKDALYRESGEADYDEAGSPEPDGSEHPVVGTRRASVTELHRTAEPDDTDRRRTLRQERTTPD